MAILAIGNANIANVAFFMFFQTSYINAEILETLKPSEYCSRPRVAKNIYKKLRNDETKVNQETWKVAFAPDESFFAWSCGNQYIVLVPLVKAHSNRSRSLTNGDNDIADFPQQRILECCSIVYSLAFGSPSHKYQSTNGVWNLHKFSKDLILAAGLQNGEIRIWEVYTGRLLLKLMDHTGVVRELKFAPYGSLQLASASQDSSIKLWNLKDDGNMYKTLKHKNFVYSCAWSPDAQKLVSVGKSRTAFVWNMTTYNIILQLKGHVNSISDCAFSPDGSLIATASYDSRAIIWDSFSGKKLRIMSHLLPQPSMIFASGENDAYVRSVSFSNDGCHLATVADDGYMRIWDLSDNKNANPVETCYVDKPLCCCYSPSGSCIAVGVHQRLQKRMFIRLYVQPLVSLTQRDIFESQDSNFERSRKVAADLNKSIVCYREIYNEKKKTSFKQKTLGEFVLKKKRCDTYSIDFKRTECKRERNID
ncbi:WD repeat and SOCS box-containing protein 1 [Nymphon striatum]|nr:WD repeat and SOCS box-containing protein 1 [Nymphon striatum]